MSISNLRCSHHEDSKRTKILRLKNIRFKKEGASLDHNSPTLLQADLVVITFEFQKNNRRNKTVHMFRTEDDLLCPVRSWAITVRRLWNTIPQANEDMKVCTYLDQGTIREIDSSYARSRIRSTV